MFVPVEEPCREIGTAAAEEGCRDAAVAVEERVGEVAVVADRCGKMLVEEACEETTADDCTVAPLMRSAGAKQRDYRSGCSVR
jgi:hypothetical protein